MVFRWAFGGIQVGNTFTTGGHLVVFRWAFGGIQVGNTVTTGCIWWYSGGHLVIYRWENHEAYFFEMATPVGPHQNTMLAPATANEQKLSWPQLD